MNSKKFIEQWHDNFLSGNHDFLDNILDDNVVFISPIVFKPIEGKLLTKLYLMAAGNTFNLEKFKYNVTKMAKEIGMERTAIYRKLKLLNIKTELEK